jgi:hypothetical protein
MTFFLNSGLPFLTELSRSALNQFDKPVWYASALPSTHAMTMSPAAAAGSLFNLAPHPTTEMT